MGPDWPVYLALPLLLGSTGGWLAGRFDGPRLLSAWLLAPVIAYTLFLASAKPAPEGFWLWWSIGLIFIGVPVMIWTAGAFLGYLFGRRQ